MKIAALIINLFAITNLVSGASLRKKALDGRNLGQLHSKECAPMMMKKFLSALELATAYSTAEFTDYVCNPVQRNAKADNQKKMKTNMATQTDSCTKAFMREMAKKTGFLLNVFGSKEACESEITKELQALKQIAKKVQAVKPTKKVGAVDTRGDDDDYVPCPSCPVGPQPCDQAEQHACGDSNECKKKWRLACMNCICGDTFEGNIIGRGAVDTRGDDLFSDLGGVIEGAVDDVGDAVNDIGEVVDKIPAIIGL